MVLTRVAALIQVEGGASRVGVEVDRDLEPRAEGDHGSARLLGHLGHQHGAPVFRGVLADPGPGHLLLQGL